MSSITYDQIANYVGSVVTDIYGKKVGVLVSFDAEIDGTVKSIQIYMNDEEVVTIPASRVEVGADGVKILPEWLFAAKQVERKLDVLKRRLKALDELHTRGEITDEEFADLKGKIDVELEKVKNESKAVKELMRKRAKDLETQVAIFDKVMLNTKTLFLSGDVNEKAFKVSVDLLKGSKQKLVDEKKDIEKHILLIERLESELFSVPQKAPEAPIAMAPSAPLAVKVVG